MARRRALVTAAFAAVTALVISAAPAGAAARRTSRSATPTPPAPAPAATSTTVRRASARSTPIPSLIAAAKGYALNFRACSGAKISDVTGSQLSALSASTAT